MIGLRNDINLRLRLKTNNMPLYIFYFKGLSGEVRMDGNADKMPLYSVWQINEQGDAFEHCANIDMKRAFGQV